MLFSIEISAGPDLNVFIPQRSFRQECRGVAVRYNRGHSLSRSESAKGCGFDCAGCYVPALAPGPSAALTQTRLYCKHFLRCEGSSSGLQVLLQHYWHKNLRDLYILPTFLACARNLRPTSARRFSSRKHSRAQRSQSISDSHSCFATCSITHRHKLYAEAHRFALVLGSDACAEHIISAHWHFRWLRHY